MVGGAGAPPTPQPPGPTPSPRGGGVAKPPPPPPLPQPLHSCKNKKNLIVKYHSLLAAFFISYCALLEGSFPPSLFTSFVFLLCRFFILSYLASISFRFPSLSARLFKVAIPHSFIRIRIRTVVSAPLLAILSRSLFVFSSKFCFPTTVYGLFSCSVLLFSFLLQFNLYLILPC